MRHGFSLLEVIISLGLLAGLMIGVSEILDSNRSLEGMMAAEDDLNLDADFVAKTITSDLAQSGWHSANYSQDANVSALLPGDFAADRAVDSVNKQRYWPYVLCPLQGHMSAPTAGYGFALRDSAMVDLKKPLDSQGNALLPGSLTDDVTAFGAVNRSSYLSSYYARSQELIFLKQITTGWSATPGVNSEPREIFRRTYLDAAGNTIPFDWNDASDANRAQLSVLYASPYQKQADGSYKVRPGLDANGDVVPDAPYGEPMRSAILDPAGGQFRFRSAWQTNVAPTYDPVLVPDVQLREYSFAVVPGLVGFGRLVRAYKIPLSSLPSKVVGTNPGELISQDSSGTYGMVVEKVLSEHCVRVLFDTARTDSNLDISQVRVRVYLARRSTASVDTVVKQVVDIMATMRARNTVVDRTDDRNKYTPLSSTGVGLNIPGFLY